MRACEWSLIVCNNAHGYGMESKQNRECRRIWKMWNRSFWVGIYIYAIAKTEVPFLSLAPFRVQVAKRLSSSRRYSPISAWRKHTIPVGSRRLASAVDRAVTPKPCEERRMSAGVRAEYLERGKDVPTVYHSYSTPQPPSAQDTPRSTSPHAP